MGDDVCVLVINVVAIKDNWGAKADDIDGMGDDANAINDDDEGI